MIANPSNINDYNEMFVRLSLKYNLPKTVIETICFSQFKLLKEVMQQSVKNEPDTFKNVRMKKLGLFYANIPKIIKFKKIADANRDKINQ